ncbi:MAG TPA: biotin/lipoyl-containing protein [Gaiellaceae bacterium]|nr:biotin/lipoyl-containing protein [Gaiellaceae bacterium]
MALNDDDVREILRIIDESDLDELRVETGELSLHVVRSAAAPAPVVVDAEVDAGAIVAPMLGTFYRAPAPGEAPFVEVGSKVEPDTLVCIIEVMKMMNSVHAGVAGTIAEICVENGDAVEYGTPLFRVEQ